MDQPALQVLDVNPGGDAVTNARLGLWLGGSLLLHALVVQFVDVSVDSARPSMGSLRVTLLNASPHDGGAMSSTVVSTLSPTEPAREQRSQIVAPTPPVIVQEPPMTVDAVVDANAISSRILPDVDKPVVATLAHRAIETPAAKQADKVRSRVKVPQRKPATTNLAMAKPAAAKVKAAEAKAKPEAVVTRPPVEGKSVTGRIAGLGSPAPAPRKGNEAVQRDKRPATSNESTSTSLASVSTAANAGHSGGVARIAGRESTDGAAADPGADSSLETSLDVAGHAVFLQLLHAAIDGHKRYPRMARRMRREGVATVLFRIHPDGDLDALTLADSSGFAALDEAALRAVAAVAPFAPATKFLTRETRFRVGVKFHLY